MKCMFKGQSISWAGDLWNEANRRWRSSRTREHYNAIIQPAIALMRRANHQSQTDVKYSYRESTTNGPLSVAEKLQLNSHQSRRNKSEKNANRQTP